MRKRMIDPEFWLDEELASIAPTARLLYIGLWNLCDDNYATLPNKPSWIKVQIFPYQSVNIPQLLNELSKIGKIVKFTSDKQEFWYVKNFFKYQRVEKPSKAKYPKYLGVVGEESGNTPAEVKLSKDKLSEINVGEVKKGVSAGDGGVGFAKLKEKINTLRPKA